jgi:lipopolysaccharide/colanic/teichoic acid biosynthesis glycosyltransferase
MKRIFDVLLAFIGLLGTLPLFAVIAICIKVDSEGPVFYRGVRAGLSGKPFRMFKFRTMVMNADRIGGPSSAANDPRITRVGRFLRRYKLDELPQLVNVLNGDMSFVGPRPEVLEYVAMFNAEEQAILSVPPGITDWSSIWNRHEGAILARSSDPERTYLEQIRPQKIRLQLEYVRNRSFSTDLRILLETIRVLLLKARAPEIDTENRGAQS